MPSRMDITNRRTRTDHNAVFAILVGDGNLPVSFGNLASSLQWSCRLAHEWLHCPTSSEGYRMKQ